MGARSCSGWCHLWTFLHLRQRCGSRQARATCVRVNRVDPSDRVTEIDACLGAACGSDACTCAWTCLPWLLYQCMGVGHGLDPSLTNVTATKPPMTEVGGHPLDLISCS